MGCEKYVPYFEDAIKTLHPGTDRFSVEDGHILADNTHQNKRKVREIQDMARKMFIADHSSEQDMRNYFADVPIFLEETGYLVDGKCEINYSSILSCLIKEAAEHCERYASDLFHLWNTVKEKLDAGAVSDELFMFGFTEDGVDYKDEVLYHASDVESFSRYKSLWGLLVTTEGTNVKMALKALF